MTLLLRVPRRAAATLRIVAVLAAFASYGPEATAADPPVRLSAAAEFGAFNVGTAQATAAREPDPAAGGDVLKLDYRMPRGTAVGVWAKAFPGGLSAESADVVRAGVRAADAGAKTLTADIEIKGTAGVQRVPVRIDADGTLHETAINWAAVGAVNEVVVAFNNTSDAEAAGTAVVDVRFEQLSLARKLGTSPVARVGGVILFALVAAALVGVLRSVLFPPPLRGRVRVGGETPAFGMQPPIPGSLTPHPNPPPQGGREQNGLRRDFVLGSGVVAVAALVVGVFHLGDLGPLEAGWTALAVAAAGVVLAAWLKFGLTGRAITAVDVFLSAVGSGVPAASASPLALLQAPAAWSEVLQLSATAAAATVLVFHVFNLCRLAVAGRHVGPAAAGLIVGTPYVLGVLLLLRSDALVRTLGDTLAAGALTARPDVVAFVGRVVVAFAFFVAVAHGLSFATTRRPLRSLAAHLSMLAVAVGTVAAPWVAAAGSGHTVAGWPDVPRTAAVLLATMLSQAGLWAAGYLVTGFVLDALGGKGPSAASAADLPVRGAKKGMVYSGVFMAVLWVPAILWDVPAVRWAATELTVPFAAAVGALVFPLMKTVIETFDGSVAFFRRAGTSYRNPVLYARGAVAGLGVGYGIVSGLSHEPTPVRAAFGFFVGVAAFAGVNLLRDVVYGVKGVGGPRSWRSYHVEALLGGAIGAAIGFYLDATQVETVVAKFHRYTSVGTKPDPFGVYPFLSKWGFIDLGATTGGPSLLFAEALAGVLEWSIAAWLFALNRTVMTAYFRKESAPVRNLFTADGLLDLGRNTIEVLRWGLWMSPIIKSFIRPMGEPTWYNQDGAVRTLIATFQDVTQTPDAFDAWSLGVFISLLAYDPVRILIWLDHMGLRVATLVNLSFLGMDKLDGRLARFLAPAATARCVPEAVKRFTTWAPLLIPFYIPRGADWDYAWDRSQALQRESAGHGLTAEFLSFSLGEQALFVAAAIVAASLLFAAARRLKRWLGWDRRPDLSLASSAYEVTVTPDGGAFSRVPGRGYDVTRRSYDRLDPAGRALFVVDGWWPARSASGSASPISGRHHSDEEAHEPLAERADHQPKAWPVLGNFPADIGPLPTIEQHEHALTVRSDRHELRTTVEITLAGDDPAEVWTVTVENATAVPRDVKLVPYLEWVLNRPDADRGHTQYNRLFAEMEYVAGLHAVLAWDKHAKATGVLATDAKPAGFLTARVDFLGRARSVWHPRALETLAFTPAADEDGHPTFDPIGSLLIPMTVPANGSTRVRFLVGMTKDKRQAVDLVARHLGIPGADAVSHARRRKELHPVGHGEIPPGTPAAYSEFSPDGRRLVVPTVYTPRPYDHTMSNRLGHVVSVTNRGLHTTSNVNSQQNRLTPDWADTVTRELPGEAFYLYDPDRREWYSPTFHPLNDPSARYQAEFGVDGTATFHMTRGDLQTELTVFVPPDEPAGVYRLTVRNRSGSTRRIRVAPYFQMVLAGQPEWSGPLQVRHDPALGAVYFTNPRNSYRTGPAFVAVSPAAERVVTRRGLFFGDGQGVTRPAFVSGSLPPGGGGLGWGGSQPATGGSHSTREASPPTLTLPLQGGGNQNEDDRAVAAFLTTLEIPANGEATVVVVLGQADDRRQAEATIRKLCDPAAAATALAETRAWWLRLMDTVRVRTDRPEFDRYLDWLRYQALAERIWARRGFYQASGAFGFRDQLQDSVNLIWMDPAIARRQIVLHASQQFLEGDVVHWFHQLQDGRTGFVGRTHASDNLLWLAWGVVEYVSATADETLLDERTSYLDADKPFEPLPPGKGGMGFDPLRSPRADTVYRHCLKAIDLVLDRRMGAHGLPLMGTGDWNDGLDEIGSEGRGESVWLGFFLHYILDRMTGIIGRREGSAREGYYLDRLQRLAVAIEATWRGDRYLRAFHDDGTEIGVKGSGVWEIDALTAAWAVMAGINPDRGRVVFDTAVEVLERDTTVLLGWPALREDSKPYLGRSSAYPEGVRENGMYCHGDQWLVGAARLLADRFERDGNAADAARYRETAYRLWRKISPLAHVGPDQIETYGGQPNKQAADMVTSFDPGRMIWHGYTGAAGWMFRQALEGVLGLRLVGGKVIPPAGPAGEPRLEHVHRTVS